MAKVAEAFIGAVFGRLTVTGTLRRLQPTRVNMTRTTHSCECICACGSTCTVWTHHLGVDVVSCGCFRKETTGNSSRTHGLSKTKTHTIWCSMLARTQCVTHPDYAEYSRRAPPERWHSFEAFVLDMGECPEGLTLERSDNRLPYGPENCVWASLSAQQSNKSTSNRVNYRGNDYSVRELAILSGRTEGTINQRLDLLWSVDDVVHLPHGARPISRKSRNAKTKLYGEGENMKK